MNLMAVILTSALASAVVASFFNLIGQAVERRARRRELVFMKSLELAKANREFVAMVADKTGQTARIHDYVVYAEMYFWLLTELHDHGTLPEDWRERTTEKFGEL